MWLSWWMIDILSLLALSSPSTQHRILVRYSSMFLSNSCLDYIIERSKMFKTSCISFCLVCRGGNDSDPHACPHRWLSFLNTSLYAVVLRTAWKEVQHPSCFSRVLHFLKIMAVPNAGGMWLGSFEFNWWWLEGTLFVVYCKKYPDPNYGICLNVMATAWVLVSQSPQFLCFVLTIAEVCSACLAQ